MTINTVPYAAFHFGKSESTVVVDYGYGVFRYGAIINNKPLTNGKGKSRLFKTAKAAAKAISAELSA